MDAISTFIQGNIKDPIYIKIPPGYITWMPDTLIILLLLRTLACLLFKALYSLKQLIILWLKKIQATFKKLRFILLHSDECVY